MFQHVRDAAGLAPIQVSQAARMAMVFSFCTHVLLRALHAYFTCARAHAKKHSPNPAPRNACASRTRTHKSNSRALSKPRGQIISSRAHGHTGTFLTGTHGHTGTRAHGHICHGHTGTFVTGTHGLMGTQAHLSRALTGTQAHVSQAHRYPKARISSIRIGCFCAAKADRTRCKLQQHS